MITIDRPYVVGEIENFLVGKINKQRFNYLVEQGKITQDEYNKIIRVID
jgi:hypothetical protein